MPEHNLSGVDSNAGIEINRIEPAPTLPRGGYQIRITVLDPEPRRAAITVDHDGFAGLLYRVLLGDDSLRTDVTQKLSAREGKAAQHVPPAG